MSLAALVGLYGSDSDSDSPSDCYGTNSDNIVAGGSSHVSGTDRGSCGASLNGMKVGEPNAVTDTQCHAFDSNEITSRVQGGAEVDPLRFPLLFDFILKHATATSSSLPTGVTSVAADISQHLAAIEHKGFDLTSNIRGDKDFGNPSILAKTVSHFKIDMFGSNFASNSVSGKKRNEKNGDIEVDLDLDIDIVGNKANFIESLVAEVNAMPALSLPNNVGPPVYHTNIANIVNHSSSNVVSATNTSNTTSGYAYPAVPSSQAVSNPVAVAIAIAMQSTAHSSSSSATSTATSATSSSGVAVTSSLSHGEPRKKSRWG